MGALPRDPNGNVRRVKGRCWRRRSCRRTVGRPLLSILLKLMSSLLTTCTIRNISETPSTLILSQFFPFRHFFITMCFYGYFRQGKSLTIWKCFDYVIIGRQMPVRNSFFCKLPQSDKYSTTWPQSGPLLRPSHSLFVGCITLPSKIEI